MARRPPLLIAAAMLSLLTVSGPVPASEPALGLDDVETITGADPSTGEIGATPVEPDADIVDPRPHAWDHIVVHGDGQTLDIYFWGGVEDCYGLHGVTVTPIASGIDVQLLSGMQPDLGLDTACIEIANLYVTTVTLVEPVIAQDMG